MVAPSNPINAREDTGTNRTGTSLAISAMIIGSESDRLLLFSTQSEDAVNFITGADFDGDAMTEIGKITEGANENRLWAFVAPANKTADINITTDGVVDSCTFIAWYHSDAEQIVPVEGLDSNSNPGLTETAIAVDCITSGADRTIIAGGGHGDGNIISSGETLIHEIVEGSVRGAASYHQQAVAGTRNMDFTFAASRRPNIIAVAIRPVVVGESFVVPGSTIIRRRDIMIGY